MAWECQLLEDSWPIGVHENDQFSFVVINFQHVDKHPGPDFIKTRLIRKQSQFDDGSYSP